MRLLARLLLGVPGSGGTASVPAQGGAGSDWEEMGPAGDPEVVSGTDTDDRFTGHGHRSILNRR